MDGGTWLVIGGAIAVLATVGLLYLALRGRRIGDGQCCANCDYQLTGLPATSTRCPECGTEVSLADGTNVRTGGRRQSKKAVVACIVLMGAAAGWEKTNITDWFKRPADRKPTWLLLRNASSKMSTIREPALIELRTRETDGKLDQPQRSRLIDAALTDMSLRNNVFFGYTGPEWILDQRAAGHVSDAQWKRFFDTAPPKCTMRPVVSSVEPFYVDIRETPLAWGCKGAIDYTITELAINGQRLRTHSDNSWQLINLKALCPDLPAGKHDIAATVSAKIYAKPFDGKVQWTGVVTIPFEYRTDGSSTVELVHDPKKADEYMKLISLKLSVNGDTFEGNLNHGGGLYLSHDVYVRLGTELKSILYLRGGYISGSGISTANMLPAGTKTVDLVLRPNRKRAAETTDLLKMLDHELEFKDVPVTYSKAEK